MSLVIISGYTLAFFMGLTLGLIGAGGSILAVPIMVYLFGVKPIIATAYSLLIVGITASVGAVRYWHRGLVSVKDALIFAAPAMISVLFTRRFLLPAIPDPVFNILQVSISKDMLIMLCFATLMLLAGWFMLKPRSATAPALKNADSHLKIFYLLTGSAMIGIITGMVGAGGGFLIIPTLISLFRLPMKMAIGTSLTIITINSLIGFQGDLIAGIQMDWPLLIVFIACTVGGMLAGTFASSYIEGEKLKKFFALFTLTTAILILVEQFWEF